MKRETIFSPDRKYRYTLWRTWDFEYGEGTRGEVEPKFVAFIGLNPSTADETKDDPTIRRCIGFAKDWGFGALCMLNAFAFRATDPEVMKRQDYPIGVDNILHIQNWCSRASLVVAAWGTHGNFRGHDINVKQWVSASGATLFCLGRTAAGHPKHPLYLKKDTKPILYQ